MKLTLLEIVQEILSNMDSDEVNSIDDTVESEQVATIVKSTYQAMISSRFWPHTRRSIQITSYSDTAKPTHMRIQDSIQKLDFLNYDKVKLGATKKDYQKIEFLEPDQFIFKTNKEDSSAANVLTVTDPGGIELLIRTDKAPQYYTSFDDETVVFDSYDSSVDSTLKASKVQAQAYVFPAWSTTDSFIPDLPEYAFTALVEEAKAKAMFSLKQMVDQKAEQESARQNRWIARKSRRVSGGIEYPSYGRGKVHIPRESK